MSGHRTKRLKKRFLTECAEVKVKPTKRIWRGYKKGFKRGEFK